MDRRIFLKNSAMASLSFALSPALLEFGSFAQKLSFGIITDLHQDIMHDGPERLDQFLSQVKKKSPDAIIQLGDFAYPSTSNLPLIEAFNAAHPESHHVIGNHDTDSGHTKAQCLEVWGMPAPYYSKVIKGVRLIVLDGNEKGSPTHQGGYASYIGPEQVAWMEKELQDTQEPVLILSHQPLAGVIAVDNAPEIQNILSKYASKILLCVNGHSHIDQHLVIGQVNYLHINSASYYWVGEDYKHPSYDASVIKDHPTIEMTCPYEDSLFAFLTIDPPAKKVTVTGRKSRWVGHSPAALGYKTEGDPSLANLVVPEIKNLRLG